MDFISMFLGIVFTAFGIVFACGRGHIYLTAWKNMTREEKEKINIVPLCRNIGGVIALCGAIFIIKGVFNGFGGRPFTAVMILWLAAAGIDLWHISKSPIYRR